MAAFENECFYFSFKRQHAPDSFIKFCISNELKFLNYLIPRLFLNVWFYRFMLFVVNYQMDVNTPLS